MSARQEAPAALAHFVSDAPFDPHSIEALSPEQERYYAASQWRMMWWRFCRHRLALWSALLLGALYLSIAVSELLAPYDLHSRHSHFVHAPPQEVRLFHEGSFAGPYVHPLRYELDMDTFKREYHEDTSRVQRVRFLCRGDAYEFWGLFEGDFHLVCPPQDGTLFLLGTDRLGRDLLSRIIYGARISLTVGLVGIAVSFLIGLVLGGLAGYYGGWVDATVQRLIEIIRSFPELPLWMALSAALPVTWSPIGVFFGITIILGLIDWTGLARAVRSKLLALREEDFCTAAILMGARPGRDFGVSSAGERGVRRRPVSRYSGCRPGFCRFTVRPHIGDGGRSYVFAESPTDISAPGTAFFLLVSGSAHLRFGRCLGKRTNRLGGRRTRYGSPRWTTRSASWSRRPRHSFPE